MRYMYLVIPAAEMTGPPPQRLMEEMTKLIEKRTADGSLIDTGGLLPTGLGAARVTLKQGKLSVTDGPFAESKEVVGGYAIFEFATREEALQSALEFMEVHRLHMPGWDGICEMRPIASHEDASCGQGAERGADRGGLAHRLIGLDQPDQRTRSGILGSSLVTDQSDAD